MSSRNKAIVNLKSSEKLLKFLEKSDLHKKDFAEMIGVTLSYVYNLIDNNIPFSTRGTTIERIATVMDVLPEEFDEYRIPQEPILIDESIEYIKDRIKSKKMPVYQFLKGFPRKKRVEVVDMLRGALPIPLDWNELSLIGKILDIDKEEIYTIWENRMKSMLETAGLNLHSNSGLISSMFNCAKDYVLKN